jgi:hypothetical protein
VDDDIPYDAMVTLLVFLVGVPAIVLQTLPSEVRRVVAKRWGFLLADLAAPVLFAVAISLGGIFAPRFEPWLTRVTWTGVLGILVLTTMFTVFRILGRYGRRVSIVRALEREVGRRVRRTGRLREASLADLVDLGRQSQPGREKEMVLESLRSLCASVCAHPRYRGDSFEDLTLGVVDMVTTQPLPGNGQNLTTATRIMQDIIVGYERSHTNGTAQLKHADLIGAIRALSRLGRSSFAAGSEAVSLSIVQAAASARAPRAAIFVSQALFEVGIAALEADQILVAMSATEKLMSLVEAQKPAKGELVADTLGMLAHFYASGETGRQFARLRLERMEACLADPLAMALDAATAHCAQTTQFRTADQLRHLAALLRSP